MISSHAHGVQTEEDTVMVYNNASALWSHIIGDNMLFISLMLSLLKYEILCNTVQNNKVFGITVDPYCFIIVARITRTTIFRAKHYFYYMIIRY